MFVYKVSDLFKRAKQLSDLEGTNFITWNEVVSCINESYIGLFQKLINMGDKSFTDSFMMSEREKELPSDFWQLEGVYLYNNGNLQTINRRAENAGEHFLSYEIRNGKIYIFGSASRDVQVKYYIKPTSLFMPPMDKELTFGLEGETMLDCHEHTFLYKDENDKINIFDLDKIKNADDIFENYDITKCWITSDFAFTIYDNALTVYNLATGFSTTINGAIPLVREDGTLFVIYDGYICELVYNGSDYEPREITEFTLDNECNYYVCNNDFTDFYGLKGMTIYHNGLSIGIYANKIIYADNKCYYVSVDKAGYYEKEEEHTIRNGIGNPIGFIGINDKTGYGYATKKYNKYFVCAYCEDTELNFPSTFYFQMLSYLLAIAFRCKQGADITLLSSQLEMVSQTFEDTLGNDDYQFTRMGNVYR